MPSGTRPQPPTRACKLVFQCNYALKPWANVMWLYLTGSGEITVPELNDLAGACSAAYADNLLPLVSNLSVLEETKVVLYAGGGDVFEGVSSVGGTGGRTGQGLTAGVAACITWQIAPHYRGGHPRTYLCGIDQPSISGVDAFTGGYVSALNSAANAFHTAIEDISGISSGISTVEHGVLSFVRDGAWRTPPVFYRIAGASVDSRVDTQRRRLGRDR